MPHPQGPPADAEPHLPSVLVTLTAGGTAAVLATLPLAVAPGSVGVAAAWTVGGAGAVVAAHLALRRAGWLPFVPAAVTLVVLMAVSGGSTSPYRPLLLVLLVGAATLRRARDVVIVALLVAVTVLSPVAYEPPEEYLLVTNGLDVFSWVLAAVLVWRVAGNLRTARRHVVERTRLVSAVIGSLPQQAAVVDASGTIVLTNAAWDRAHALGADNDGTDAEVADYARVCRTRRGAAALMAPELGADLRDILTGVRTTAVSELSWELLAGEARWFTVRTSCLPDGLGAVVTHEDITPLIEAERARQANLALAREFDARKSALLRAVSHDVRTPLTVISGVTDTLRRSRHRLDDADIQKLLDGLTSQSRRLAQLLSGLLTLSSDADEPATDEASLRRLPVDVHTRVSQLIDQIEPAGHRIDLTPPACPVIVGAVPWIVDSVVQRLVDNAVRHTPQGTTIGVDIQMSDDRTLVVHVRDDGPGIPADDRDRIFLPFERGSQADPYDPGAGIGLTAVREAARLHGGDIWLEASTPGRTSFRVELLVDPA